MNCLHCDEPLLDSEPWIVQPIFRAHGEDAEGAHYECFIRMVMGSAAHQLGDCTCKGGCRHDPEHLSVRESAKLAAQAFYALNSRC